MLKWIVGLVIVGALYFLIQNRDDLWMRLTEPGNGLLTQWNRGPSAPRDLGNEATGLLQKLTGRTAWGERKVGSLSLDLPFSLQSRPVTVSQPNVHLEGFLGEAGGRAIYLTYGRNSTLVGGVMLSWGDSVLALGARKLNMSVISRNTASTLIRGLRVRRSDYVQLSGSPRLRARCALLERGAEAWCLEFHSLEGDTEAEKTFLRIVNSARPL